MIAGMIVTVMIAIISITKITAEEKVMIKADMIMHGMMTVIIEEDINKLPGMD